MKNLAHAALVVFLFLVAGLFLIACPTDSEREVVLDIPIDKNNDSLLTFDTLIIKVHSKDSDFVQEVFHGKLTDPKKLIGLPLDGRVGREFTVSIVGYKGGKLGMHQEITVLDLRPSGIKDLPVKDTIEIGPGIPEILSPADTSVAEGGTLRFRVNIRNPWEGSAALSLKDAPPGATLDTAGTASQYAYFTFTPTFNQGRSEAYAVTFVYSSLDRRIEKIMNLSIHNVNRPPKLAAIADQKVKENESLAFKVEASDPDGDTLTLLALDPPTGAEFKAGSFTWKPTVGQAGNYSVKLKAFDGQDSDFVAVLITVGDVEPPPPLTLEIVSPAGDTSVNSTPITLHYMVNGKRLQKPVPLKEGKNRLFLDTTVAGRTAFDTIHVTLDTTPPGAPKVKGPTPVNTRTPTWTWSSGGGGIGTYRHRVDSEDLAGSALSKDTAYIPPKDLEPGTHTLFVQERDEAGNWSPVGRHAIRIDTTHPAPPVVSANVSSPTNDPRPSWSWSANGDDVAGIYRYKLNSPDFRSGATETRTLGFRPGEKDTLSEGQHVLYVQQQDSAGNWSAAASHALIVDRTPPRAPVFSRTPLSPLNGAKLEFSWESGGEGGSGTYRYKLNNADLEKESSLLNIGKYAPTENFPEGAYTLFVQERDAAGNWSPTASRTLVLALPGIIGTPGFTRGETDVLSFALHGTGEAYVAYIEGTEGYKVAVMRWSGTAWDQVGKLGFSEGIAAYPSLALSPKGTPYVAFVDSPRGHNVTVMRWTGSVWETVGTAGFAGPSVSTLSLAISSTGVPYVAFTDDKARVMRFNGTKWEDVGNPGFSPGSIGYPSLALDKTSVPYVAFRDDGNGHRASVMRYSGSTWEYVGAAGFTGGIISTEKPISMVLDGTGTPHVAYIDGANGSKATVVKYSGSSWVPLGRPGFSAGAMSYPSLAIDANGEIYVAFSDYAQAGRATVMRFNGSDWISVGKAGVSEGEARFPSLALSSTGVPYVAFSDGAKESKATVLKTAFDP